jgi:hypothetical protein
MSASSKRKNDAAVAGESRARKVSKKDQILSLYLSGMTEIEDLALITTSRPSYIGSVLQEGGVKTGYFDLYTSTQQPMNVYSKFFANKLGFKDEESARKSVELIEHLYRQFETAGDRAGQHHALMIALTMFDRARWTGKSAESDIFRRWLSERLDEAEAMSKESREGSDADA